MVKVKRKRKPLVDAMPLFQKVCIEEGTPFSRSRKWTRGEADGTVSEMFSVYVSVMEELASYVESEDWDTIVALAKQEETRRMIRGTM